MSSEILSVLEYMETEKGSGRADMIDAIVNAIKTAALKSVNAGQEIKIDINPKNGQLHAWLLLKVVDSVSNPRSEIHIEKAQLIKPGAQLGDILDKEMDPASLGRIAAQTARQAVMQKLRQFEKDRVYDDFKDVIGNIVTGTVRRKERNDIYIDLGKAEAVLSAKEQVPGEEYQPGLGVPAPAARARPFAVRAGPGYGHLVYCRRWAWPVCWGHGPSARHGRCLGQAIFRGRRGD